MLTQRGAVATLLGAVVLAGLTACGPAATPAVEPGKVSVVAAFYPLQFLSERIGGDAVTVQTLTQPGSEPHDLELSPRQIAALTKADLVVFQKGFQAAVDQGVVTAEVANVVDVNAGITLRPAPEVGHHEAGEEGAAHDHAEPAEADHDQETTDPHIWLSPANMITMARTVTDGLIRADPANGPRFEQNYTALAHQLTDLDDGFRTGLQNCRRTEFITSHAAFGYLAGRYGLTQIGISGLEPDAEPSPARIAEVQAEATDHAVTTIFYETLVSPGVARSIAGDLGLQTAVLDPVEGLTDASAGQDYLQVMRANLDALQAANGCTP